MLDWETALTQQIHLLATEAAAQHAHRETGGDCGGFEAAPEQFDSAVAWAKRVQKLYQERLPALLAQIADDIDQEMPDIYSQGQYLRGNNPDGYCSW